MSEKEETVAIPRKEFKEWICILRNIAKNIEQAQRDIRTT